MNDDFEQGWEMLQQATPINESGAVTPSFKPFDGREPLSFIITKGKTNSWVDDLYLYGSLEQVPPVYH